MKDKNIVVTLKRQRLSGMYLVERIAGLVFLPGETPQDEIRAGYRISERDAVQVAQTYNIVVKG